MRAVFLSLLLAFTGPAAAGDAVQSFLDRHWARPVLHQGKAPSGYSPLEAALDPQSCGTCHIAQLADWKDSRHARAMDPGVLGQLLEMEAEDRSSHQDCLRCHAPLAEQADALAAQIRTGKGGGLHRHGMMCASCHVRGHKRYGPPRRDGSVPQTREALPHGGFIVSTAFQDSRFCASCHQFEADGYAINGKLLENTYEEWKSSRYAQEGKQCQSCHMPDRRHLWRGIHDAEMVGSGVKVTSTVIAANGRAQGSLTLRNSGIGHLFPTYLTPMVYLEVFQESRSGKVIAGTLMQDAIGRKVPLDLSRELFDTRLAPDAEHTLAYDKPLHRSAVAVVARVRVEPDAFYADFYRSLLADGQAGKGTKLIRQALKEANASGFDIYRERYPVKRQ